MKFPNGFGSITRLSGNRRRPWAIRKTVDGKQRYIAFCATYEDALAYLADYNKAPQIYSNSLTFADVYRLDMQERRPNIARITAKNYDISFAKCAALYARKLSDITVAELQAVIKRVSDDGIGYATQKRVRQVMHNIYKYAVKYQIIPQTGDISGFVDVDKPQCKYKKQPFITRQINRVKAIADDEQHPLSKWAKCVLMMCYSGPRPSEFINILKSDVKLHSRTYKVRHSKTKAGQNRIVPIAKKMKPYYDWWMQQPGKTLVTDDKGNALTYNRFRRMFNKVMKASHCHHTPHECRHTCATWLDDKGANKLSIKRILGHATTDITDCIYTHKHVIQLKKAIDLL